MTAAEREEMIDTIDELRRRKEKRDRAMETLKSVRLPDQFLQRQLGQIIAQARGKQRRDIEQLMCLEAEFEELGGNDPDGEWEED